LVQSLGMRKLRLFFLSLALAVALPTGYVAFAETDIEERERELRQELERIEAEQRELQAQLDTQRAESASYQRDINILTAEIKQAQLKIDSKNIEIQRLGKDIDLKSKTVAELSSKLDGAQGDIGQLVRKMSQMDDLSLAEVVVAEDTVADFFAEYDSYASVQTSLGELIDEIREIRGETEKEKAQLTERQAKERDLKAEIEAQKKVVAAKEAEKKVLLQGSKASEVGYASQVADKQREAAAIRAALFELRGVQGGGISFGDAVKYAESASDQTGVRVAFILAILKQETDLGKNVGTCNRAGDPPEKGWRNIMPGPDSGSSRDDQTIFLQITEELGLDPETTPLSCPWGNGWGGAMGPSQFIPTTWASYAPRVAVAMGVDTANPWNPQHAFMATAIYMQDLGAAAQTYTAERTAALRYYAGGNWNLPQNAFYGNSVMNHAAGFQTQLDFLDDADDD
jgi:membrane-bound lytic murein transglycosylase B